MIVQVYVEIILFAYPTNKFLKKESWNFYFYFNFFYIDSLIM